MSESRTHATVSPAVSSSSSANFQLVINNALDKYKAHTKKDLIGHPLVAQLQSCNSPSAILAILHQQVQELDQSRSSDERWSRWLDPTVNVIYVLSSTLAAGVSLVCPNTWTSLRSAYSFIWQVFPPSNVIFAGISVLLSVRILLVSFVWGILTPTYLRRLRTLGQAKTLSSKSSNTSKCSSDDSRPIQNCRRPWR